SLAAVFALGVGIAAQNPPATQTQPQTTMASALATVEGCLVYEKDVPGRKRDPVERVGIAEDFILTNAKVVKGSLPPAATRRAGEPTGTSGTAAGPMFDVKGLDADRLK